MAYLYESYGLSREQLIDGLNLLTQPRVVRRRGKDVPVAPVVVQEGDRFYDAKTWQAEQEIARHIRRLMGEGQYDGAPLALPPNVFGPITPDASQAAALEAAAGSRVVVLTGGPGVGKTTVSRAMIETYRHNGLHVVCAAPTGKAAVRIQEQTGMEAKTIHQLIGLRPGGDPRHTELAPIPAEVVVIDEASMVDVKLAALLFAAIRGRVLIIGDVDQLPSIGAGRVLHDIISSNKVPVVRLTKIHRQASESRIPYVARDINQGQTPDLTVTGTDVTHWEQPDPDHAAQWVVRAVTQALPSKGFQATDIQVLAPQKKGPCGVQALNVALQEALNPPFEGASGSDVNIGDQYVVRPGDRVLQTANNYDLGVMNGEIGIVIAASPDGVSAEDHLDAMWSGKFPEEDGEDGPVEVMGREELGAFDGEGEDVDAEAATGRPQPPFPGLKYDDEGKLVFETKRVVVVDYGTKKVAYAQDEARKLHLGYAITVHKSQGSQFRAVVVALHANYAAMLSRPLLYTAITRAAEQVLTVGTVEQVAQAARNTRGVERRTALRERLTSR